jgi:hypothetical protein
MPAYQAGARSNPREIQVARLEISYAITAPNISIRKIPKIWKNLPPGKPKKNKKKTVLHFCRAHDSLQTIYIMRTSALLLLQRRCMRRSHGQTVNSILYDHSTRRVAGIHLQNWHIENNIRVSSQVTSLRKWCKQKLLQLDQTLCFA